MASPVSRAITLVIELGADNFGANTGQIVTVAGLRVNASINLAGGIGSSVATIRVSGLNITIMNTLSSLSVRANYSTRRNTISVFAGDSSNPKNSLPLVFAGNISEAWADFSGAPETSFIIQAFGGAIENMKAVPVTSIAGSVDVVSLMRGFATTMGYIFENSGVAGVVLSNPHYDGTAIQQAQRCADDANIELRYDEGGTRTMAIYPKGGSRGGQIPLISAATGMRGYPTYCASGVSITTLFNPSIRLGGQVQVQSVVPQASGLWVVNAALSHELSSETVDGPWFTTFEAFLFGQPATLAG